MADDNQKTTRQEPSVSFVGRLWSIASNSLAVGSLASMSDQYVVWIGFFRELITYYRLVRDAVLSVPFDFIDFSLLEFLNLSMPSWWHDYLTLGMILIVGPLLRIAYADLVRRKAVTVKTDPQPKPPTIAKIGKWDYRSHREEPLDQLHGRSDREEAICPELLLVYGGLSRLPDSLLALHRLVYLATFADYVRQEST